MPTQPHRTPPLVPRVTVVLYRTLPATTLLTTLATAAAPEGTLHAHGPALHGPDGADAAATIEAVARSHGSHALVWDGDSPTDLAGVAQLTGEIGADLLVAEWHPDGESGHTPLAGTLLAAPPCDLLLVRPGEISAIQRVVVAAGEGPNAPMVAGHVQRWATAFGVRSAILRTVEDSEEVPEAVELCGQLAPGMEPLTPIGRNLLGLLTEAAQESGFLALGAAEGLSADDLGAGTLGGRLGHLVRSTIVVGRSAVAAGHPPLDLRRSSSSSTRIRRSTFPTIVSGSSDLNS